jgi:hypothetical protein
MISSQRLWPLKCNLKELKTFPQAKSLCFFIFKWLLAHVVYFGCKVVPVYPMKAHRSRSLTPLILNLPRDRSAWSASCLSRYAPGKRNLGTRYGWADFRFDLDIFREKKNVLSVPGFETGSSSTYPIKFPKYVISASIFLTCKIIHLFSLHASTVVHFSC